MELAMSMKTFRMDIIAIARINLLAVIVNITLCVKMAEAVKMEQHVGWTGKHLKFIAIACLDTWGRNAEPVSGKYIILIEVEVRI